MQQGFEACQGWDQAFANHSTQRGGRIGKQKKKTNIMQDLIRRVLRRIGLGIIKKKPKEERGRFYKKKKKVEWKKNKKN